MNFDNINGYEFEELILKLLKNMGFIAEQTALSGDGGIDIIAYSEKPIFKGKYLIQCKNWKNKIGQPEVRDLYGVTMNECANKGILITTSYFTQQAENFAENKNIELIDYNVLVNLFEEYGIELNENAKTNTKKFTDFENFDKEKYDYLKTKIEDNRSEDIHYYTLQDFYHKYFTSKDYEIIKNGLLDNYINLNNEVIKRFCNKKKNNVRKLAIEYMNAFLYLLKGDIYKCVDICKDNGFFNQEGIGFLPPMDENDYLSLCNKDKYYDSKSKVSKDEYNQSKYDSYYRNCDTKLVLLKDLFLILDKFNYETGADFIKGLFNKNILEYEERLKYNITLYRPEYREECEIEYRQIINRVRGFLNNPRDIKHSKIHIPIGVYVWTFYDKKQPHSYSVSYKDNMFITVDDFIQIFYKDIYDKIKSDFKKVGVLFS